VELIASVCGHLLVRLIASVWTVASETDRQCVWTLASETDR
jgi:hypothetical protein